MRDQTVAILTVGRDGAAALDSALAAADIACSRRKVRAIDGESELTKIAVAAGSHAAVKLVDGLSSIAARVFGGKKAQDGAPAAPATLLAEGEDFRCNFEVWRGDMKMTLENVPIADVVHVIAMIRKNQDPE